jgi:hypothetical protein
MINPPEDTPPEPRPKKTPPLRDPTDDGDGNPDRLDALLESADPGDAALDPRD